MQAIRTVYNNWGKNERNLMIFINYGGKKVLHPDHQKKEVNWLAILKGITSHVLPEKRVARRN